MEQNEDKKLRIQLDVFIILVGLTLLTLTIF